MNQTQSPSRITEGVIWKQILLFFFPILLGSFFQQMYNTVDTIIVGRSLGTQALAAVGSSASLINLLNGFFIGLSSGATVVLSQHYGAADWDGVKKALHTGVFLSLILGFMAMAMGTLLGPTIIRLIKTPENCLADAVQYVRIYFCGAIASMVYNMGSGILRAMGDSRRPMVFLIIACFVNIFLDILCVIVLKMGIAGAAVATVISQCISAILVIITLCCLPRETRLNPKQLRLDFSILGRILLIGFPAGLQFITFDLSNILSQSSINSFGDVTTAAWTAYAKADTIIWMVIGAFGVAITTFVGQNCGAGKYDRIRKGTWICMGMCTAMVLTLSAAEVFFREWILGIYTTDLDVIRVGSHMMLIAVPFCVLFVPVEVLGGTMRGMGHAFVPMVITGLFACVFRILWIFTLVERWHTLNMLVSCYPVSWFLCASTFLIVYFRGNWNKKHTGTGMLSQKECL